MKTDYVKKGLAIGIIVLFIGTSFASSAQLKNNQLPLTSGKTIYVDDDNTEGPWDGTQQYPYQHIQEGVDNASEGDTVYVFNGTYIERVRIYEAINLIGEDQNSTIIDANASGSAVWLESNHVTVCGFTLQNSGPEEWHDSGVHLGSMNNRADFCKIIENRIINNFDGIYSLFPTENLIENNIIIKNNHNGITLHGRGDEGKVRIINNKIIDNFHSGIIIYDTRSNIISGNIVMNNGENGIYFGTYGNSVFRNIIKNHTYGIRDAGGSSHIYLNTIEDNNIGLFTHSIRCTYEMNNLIENDCNAKYHIIFQKSFNHWNSNYWDDYSGIGPKIIEGISSKNYFLILAYLLLSLVYLRLKGELPPWPEPELEEYPTKEYDRHPALKPYNIITTQGWDKE